MRHRVQGWEEHPMSYSKGGNSSGRWLTEWRENSKCSREKGHRSEVTAMSLAHPTHAVKQCTLSYKQESLLHISSNMCKTNNT